jgi:hypothetical protein
VISRLRGRQSMTEEIDIDYVEVGIFILAISLFIMFTLMMMGVNIPAVILFILGISAMVLGALKLKSSLSEIF